MQIDSFQGEYRFLSNFYPCDITICGVPYKSTEAAYQASKSDDLFIRSTFSTVDPKYAKAMGRKMKLRPNWDELTKVECMELCLRAKFTDPSLQARLISTDPLELVEGNHWNDTFWGVCNGKGRNMLGKLLMILRDEYIMYKPQPFYDGTGEVPF
jgi:ribA/ribD-fused uncharacterized protein